MSDEAPAPSDMRLDGELTAVLDSIAVPVFFKDRAGRYAWFNATFRSEYLREFGASAADLVDQNCLDLSETPENAELTRRTDLQVLERGETTSHLIPHSFPDGHQHRLLLRKSPYRDRTTGEITGIVTLILDVTDLIETREALAETERRYRDFVYKSNAIIMGMDREGCITFCNAFAERFFGYTEAELVGRQAVGLVIPAVDDSGYDLASFIEKLRADPDAYHDVENQNLTRDGRHVWVSWTNTAVYDAGGNVIGVQAIGHDITARKQAEERLRVSEAAIASSLDAIGIADLDGRVLYVNWAYASLWGLGSVDEVIGRDIRSFMLPHEADRIFNAIHHGGWVGEREHERPDGSRLFVRVSAHLVRTPDGQPLRIMVSMQDVTQRRLAEDELTKFKLISDRATYGTVIFGPESEILYCNEAFAWMHGYEPDELLGQPLTLFHTEEQWQEAVRLGRKLRAEGQLVAERIWRVHRSGRCFPSLLSVSYIEGAMQGEPLRAASVVDISDLDSAMTQLAEQKERLAVTLRSIGDGVIATDTGQRITLMNAIAERLTGWRQEDALGRPVTEVCLVVVPDDPAAGDSIAATLETGVPCQVAAEGRLIARDGVVRRVEGVAAPITGERDELVGAVMAFRDITERERMRLEVEQAHKIESLGVLAGGIAHDLNNLLTPILGGINLAAQEMPLSADARDGLQAAEKAALQARYLSQQLLTFSRGGHPIKAPLWLGEVVRGSVDMAISGSSCSARVAFADDLWPVEADAVQLTQALSNIVLNAVQAMPAGGLVSLEASNVTLLEGEYPDLPAGRYVCLTITDQGPGVDPSVLPHVFDPYFTTKPSGSGLGLTIAYSVVARHGGHITVTSTPRLGTVVAIHLPASAELPPAPVTPVAPLTPCTGRVLVMDDDPYVRKVAGYMLRRLGLEADIVADGEAAVAQVRAAQEGATPYLAALLDLTIKGGQGGAQVAQQVRALCPDLKIIACSGYHEDAVMARFADHGFDGALAKPYQVDDLAEVIARLLEADGDPLTG